MAWGWEWGTGVEPAQLAFPNAKCRPPPAARAPACGHPDRFTAACSAHSPHPCPTLCQICHAEQAGDWPWALLGYEMQLKGTEDWDQPQDRAADGMVRCLQQAGLTWTADSVRDSARRARAEADELSQWTEHDWVEAEQDRMEASATALYDDYHGRNPHVACRFLATSLSRSLDGSRAMDSGSSSGGFAGLLSDLQRWQVGRCHGGQGVGPGLRAFARPWPRLEADQRLWDGGGRGRAAVGKRGGP